jgi:asparagine synthase (glutamine-hydrolysing)
MCGLFGFFSARAEIPDNIRQWAIKAQQCLRHRGPDDNGSIELSGRKCLMGHTRLSIIDIAGGAQPLSNEDGSVWVVFNGEIYNYIELREQLRARHDFRTESDTEVLVHLYEEKGEALVDDLVGMFAFAIVDQRKGTLFLARDRFGEKPLYYANLGNGRIVFASELKALVLFPGIDLAFDYRAVAQYLALGYVPAPRTHIVGINKLRASETLTLDSMGMRKRRYWGLAFHGDSAEKEEALVEEFQALFQESVRIQLRSDVSLGGFLSGGIDSTLVLCVMRELMPNAELHSYCAGFDNPLLDERPYSKIVSTLLSTNHHEVPIDENQLAQSIWDIVLHYDEPYADYSCLPTFAVCRAASNDLKVMLSGDGADELFGGYSSYYSHYGWDGVRRFPYVNQLASPLAHIWPKGRRGSGLLKFLSQNDDRLVRSRAWNELFALTVMRPEFHAAALEGFAELRETIKPHEARRYPHSLMEVQATELTLPEQLMTKVDRASMKTSLECRAPFLDHRLAEFAASLPMRMSFKNKLGKILLRKALPGFIPDEIRWRAKRGFTPPLADWFRTTLKAELLQSIEDVPELLNNCCDPAAIRPLFNIHASGKDDLQDGLFRWLVLSKYCEDPRPNDRVINNGILSRNQ